MNQSIQVPSHHLVELMVRRLTTIGCLIATVVFLTGWMVSYVREVESFVISITPKFHIGLSDGSFWLSDQAIPYRGSVIGVDGIPVVRTFRSVDLPGVYYRRVVTMDFHFWMLSVNLMYAVFLTAFLIWQIRRRRVDRTRQIVPCDSRS